MTHYYYYVEAGAVVDSTTTVYQVAVSQSKQGDRDYLFLLSYSVTHGHYFAVRSLESSKFIADLKDAYKGILLEPVVTSIKARDLVRNFKNQLRQPLNPASLSTNHHQRNLLDLNYRIFSNLNRTNSLPSGARKKPKCI